MNESHREHTPESIRTQEAEQSILTLEGVPRTFSDTLLQVKEIERSDRGMSPDEMAVKVAEHLGVDPTQVEAAKIAIDFPIRSEQIHTGWDEAKARFDAAVRKALLPVMAALAFQAGPALSEETQLTERPKELLEASVVVKGESRELTEEEIFDLNSPLAITGEKMKKLREKPSLEELSLLKNFHEKAWQEKNEWVAVFGRDKDGKFLSGVKEGEALRAFPPVELLKKISSGARITHTHPLNADRVQPLMVMQYEMEQKNHSFCHQVAGIFG